MKESSQGRADFASKIGMVLATAGSAVGLGNIWRFPVLTGNNGGGAFILVYLLCVVCLGLPLMVAEFTVGRHAHTNTAKAYQQLSKGWLWRKIGKMGVFTGWFILCYYIVVSGWTLDYLVEALTGHFDVLAKTGNPEAYASNFNGFVSDTWKPLVFMVVFILLSHFVIVRGVQAGIEKFSKILMPMLFIILCVLTVCSLFTPGTAQGYAFLFKPDFSKLTFRCVLDAMGQSFYSLSIAMGCLTTFASYFTRDLKLVPTALQIGCIDTLVAIMAGMIIFPAVFSAGINPGEGASLVFIALPNVFHQTFGSVPVLEYVVAVLFYFLLVLATLTSVISLHEVPTAYLSERFKWSRRKAATVVTVTCIVVGGLCSLSFGVLSTLTVFDKTIFDLFDFTSGQIFLPIIGLLTALFVGWVLDRQVIRDELTNYGTYKAPGAAAVVVLTRYLAPVAIFLIFLAGIGVF